MVLLTDEEIRKLGMQHSFDGRADLYFIRGYHLGRLQALQAVEASKCVPVVSPIQLALDLGEPNGAR